MKRSIVTAALCGCLLVGSLYPRMMLERHVKLYNEWGTEIETEGNFHKEIPVKLESGIRIFFQRLKSSI